MTTRDYIICAMEAAGMNARALSEATGGAVSLQSIWRYIRKDKKERRDITTEKLDHLMRVLGLEWTQINLRKRK